MSWVAEAGNKSPDENIPLVFVDRIKVSDEEGSDGSSGCSKGRSVSGLEIETGGRVCFTRKLKSSIPVSSLERQTDKLKIQYKIDICDGECEGAFNFIKMRTETDASEVAKDAAKFLEILSTDFGTLEAVVCIDDEDGVSDTGAELIRKLIQETNGSILLLTNGLPNNIPAENNIDKVIPVMSTSVVTGEATSGSVYDTRHRGILDRDFEEPINDENESSDNMIDCVLLLEQASKYDVLLYKLAILKEIRKQCLYCVKLILDGSREMLLSMENDAYFENNIGMLVPKNTGYLSGRLYAFLEACKAKLGQPYLAQIDLILAFQKYLSGNDSIDTDMIFERIKQNFAKFHAFDDTQDAMDDVLGNGIVKGLDVGINFVMDTSEAILSELSDPGYFRDNVRTLVFKGCGGFSQLLASYIHDCVYMKECSKQKEHFMRVLELCDDESFIENINKNTPKLKVYDSRDSDSESKKLIQIVKDSLCSWLSNDYLLQMGSSLTFKEFTLIEVMAALRFDRPDVLKSWMHKKVEIDTYIFCNLRFHWCDLDKRGESKLADIFRLLPIRGTLRQLGRRVNLAVERISQGTIADCFENDGSPNVGVISPIQALIVNRVFCMQFDFVKMLWEFDKQNIIVNTIMIWILVTGILKLKIFSRESGHADLTEAKKYFAQAMQRLLDQLLLTFPDMHFQILKCRVALFRGKSLYHLAGDGKFFRFLCHTVIKRCISTEWRSVEGNLTKLKYLEELGDGSLSNKRNCTIFLGKPRIKLYSHMIMHVISYLMLAYYTLKPNDTASAILRWFLLIVISSLIVDEIRQALGGTQYTIRTSLKRWWLDSWNKLDLFTMILYYAAFFLDCGGARQASRLLFSTFTFIWCLKFYQFLRAFQSLGTYIILVQKMLLHLKNFTIVAAIAVIAYGVFMTSLLFPGLNFGSWTLFVMVLLRPYLLFFAETGIEEYDISTKNTIYSTPKVDRSSEILTVLGMCVFLMFGGVLLINLLIAIFSGVYEEVKAKSEKLWALNDLQLLQEFKSKPTVPVPFSLPINVFHIIKRLFSKVEVFLIADNENDLALKIYQHDIAERWHAQHVGEPKVVGSVSRGMELQMLEFREIIDRTQHDMLSNIKESSREAVEEMQKSVEGAIKQVGELASKKVEDIEARLQVLHVNMERKIGDAISKRNEDTNQRMKSIETRCDEIAALLKQFINSTKDM